MLKEIEVRFSTCHFTHGIQSQENPCICTAGSPACYSGGWSAEPAMKWTISEMHHLHNNVGAHTGEATRSCGVKPQYWHVIHANNVPSASFLLCFHVSVIYHLEMTNKPKWLSSALLFKGYSSGEWIK